MSSRTSDRQLLTLLLVVLGALIVLPLFTMGFGMMGGGMWGGGMWGGHMWDGQMGPGGTVPGWMFLVSALLQVLFLAVVVGVGYLVFRAVTRSSDANDVVLTELQRAYARGDLTDEEYEQRRERLTDEE